MSFTIQASELWTGSHDNRRPVAALDSGEHSHVHGCLEMRFGDRLVPHLGFFGPDDVCLGDWMEELAVALARLGSTEASEYIFDEGEQGQPAFQFTRDCQELRLSIVDSALSGGVGSKEWQNVTAGWEEFERAVRVAMEALEAEICRASPEVGPVWWAALKERIDARIRTGG